MRLILDMPPISFNGFPTKACPGYLPLLLRHRSPHLVPGLWHGSNAKSLGEKESIVDSYHGSIGSLRHSGIRVSPICPFLRFSVSPLSSCRFHLCQWQDCRTHRVLWHTSQAENIRFCRPLDAVLQAWGISLKKQHLQSWGCQVDNFLLWQWRFVPHSVCQSMCQILPIRGYWYVTIR